MYQDLEATMRAYLLEDLDAIPALRMIRLSPESIRARAEAMAAQLTGAEVIPGESVIGGGSTPDKALPTWLIAMDYRLEEKLRKGDPAVIARIENDRLLVDLRTVSAEEEPELLRALQISAF
jgi:L-seryl-tRNA(Ser) seleniumtransferase